MKKIIAAALLAASTQAQAACFFSHERVSGMNRICTYDCIEGQRSITISATSMCPLQLYKPLANRVDSVDSADEYRPTNVSIPREDKAGIELGARLKSAHLIDKGLGRSPGFCI